MSGCATCGQADEQSEYSLEFRVSIDGFTAEMNDPIRGEGTFERAVQGVLRLVAFDFLPIITAARTWPIEQEAGDSQRLPANAASSWIRSSSSQDLAHACIWVQRRSGRTVIAMTNA